MLGSNPKLNRALLAWFILTGATVGLFSGGERPFFALAPSQKVIGGPPDIYLPLLFKPEQLLPSPEVFVQITPSGAINASTFTPGSFVITNLPTHEERISQIMIDLRTAVLPDMVFDPNGVAGDVVAKDFDLESGCDSTGFINRTYAHAHDGGFDVLILNFDDFDPGEKLIFSIDVDPTSIRGVNAPGPHESGSVSGLELVGTTVTISYENGPILTGTVTRQSQSQGGGEALIRAHLPTAPIASIIGQTVPTTVSDPHQLLLVSGRTNKIVRVLIIEGGLFTDGVPGDGFDIDAFEANTALHIQEIVTTSATTNDLQIPINLTHSHENGGLNYIYVTQENSFEQKGQGQLLILMLEQNQSQK